MATRHIGVYYHKLDGGGAPRIVRAQINYLLEAGYKVTFISSQDINYVDILHDSFTALQLEERPSDEQSAFVSRSLRLRKRLKALGLDVLIAHSVRHGSRLGVIGYGLPFKLIIVDHAHPPTTISQLSWLQREGLRQILRNARFICVSKGAADSFENWLGRPVGYIYNYVPDPADTLAFQDKNRDNTVVALGRFAAEKQLDLLISAFSDVAAEHPSWSLHLYGAGENEVQLCQQARISKATEQIQIHGWVDNPMRILSEAGIVAQTSRYEGFGMALVEAMGVGAPVISFDCPFGPGEIIHDGVDGLLVENQSVPAFTVALDKLMSSFELRQAMGDAAKASITRFSLQTHIDTWIEEIERVSN